MKMIIKYEFDDEDRRLLSIDLPDNPCSKCSLNINGGCCGCSKGNKYSETTRPYKEKNIYDLALKIKRMHNLQKDIVNIQKEIDNIAKEIKDTGIFD